MRTMEQNDSFYRTARWLSLGFLMGALLLGGLVTTQAATVDVQPAAQAQKAQAQEGTPKAPAPSEKMMEKLRETARNSRGIVAVEKAPISPHHAMLEKLAGSWKVQIRMYMDGEEVDSRGAARSEMILGGKAMRMDYKGNFMGMSFLGTGTEGFDEVQGKHFSTWIDNMTPGVIVDCGECEHGESDRITYVGDRIDPESGEKFVSKSIVSIQSASQFTMEEWQNRGGEETLAMKIIYSRQN